MSHDSDPLHDQLYGIAHQAQVKARRARQRKVKHHAKAALHKHAAGDTCNAAAHSPEGMSARQQVGLRGEDRAARYLENLGLIVLERNIHCRMGEIDLIATDLTSLIFIEVRLRCSAHYGGAAASVNRHKQQRLIRTAQFFLPQLLARYFGGKMPRCRFDVITIDAQRLDWIRHAFDHTAS